MGRGVKAHRSSQGGLERGESKPMCGGYGPEATPHEEGRAERWGEDKKRPVGLRTKKKDIYLLARGGKLSI